MRQAGVLAAAGLLALREGPSGLAEDHRRAKKFTQAIARLRSLGIADWDEPETNIVFVRFPTIEPQLAELTHRLEVDVAVRVLALPGRGLRFVFHRDVGDEETERAASGLCSIVEDWVEKHGKPS